MKDVFCREASRQIEDLVIDNLVELASEWQCRSLETSCALFSVDAAFLKTRPNVQVRNMEVYGILGINLDGRNERMGLRICETECLRYWAPVLSAMIYSWQMVCLCEKRFHTEYPAISFQ
jgi:transposase-like protein